MKNYFVYIISNTNNSVIYIWITGNLTRRIWEHKNKIMKWFSEDFSLNKLVYYELYNDVNETIQREKNLKKWKREWKDILINKTNINRNDLYESLI